jgi:hypothetical protein
MTMKHIMKKILTTLLLSLSLTAPAWAQPDQNSPALCALLTPAEVAQYVGRPVGPGKALMKHNCRWANNHQISVLILAFAPVGRSPSVPADTPGYRTVPGIGKLAYVAPLPIGGDQPVPPGQTVWSGEVQTAQGSLVVALAGPAASADTAAQALKTAFLRYTQTRQIGALSGSSDPVDPVPSTRKGAIGHVADLTQSSAPRETPPN